MASSQPIKDTLIVKRVFTIAGPLDDFLAFGHGVKANVADVIEILFKLTSLDGKCCNGGWASRLELLHFF